MTQSEQTRDRKGGVFIQSRRLVARALPQADESLYGWAVRLADANGYANAKAILSLAKRGTSAPSAGILSNRLAQLVDGSPSDFERYVAAKWNGPSYHGLELGVARTHFEIQPKVCPACLADKPVLKSVWNLRLWQYCPQHFCGLIQACPFCLNRLARGQRAVTHCGNKFCGEDLSRCAGDPIPRDIANIVGMLGDAASGRRSERFQHLPESLRNTSLRDFISLVFVLSTPLLHVRNDFWHNDKDSIRERLRIAEDALTAWPHGYHRYLDQLRSIRHDKMEYFLPGKRALDREFPFLVRNLKYGSSGMADAMLDVLKEALANYFEEHFPHSKRNDIFCPSYAFKTKYNLISLIDAATLLQVSKPVIRALIQTGYIETLAHFGKTWCKVDSITDLLTKLANVAMHSVGDESRCSELGRSQSVSAAKITDIFERALNGQLQLTIKSSYSSGLRRFLFNRDDLRKLFPVAPEGYLSVPEASRYPHWTVAYLRTSLRSGLLPSVEYPPQGRMMSVHALAAFRAKYVSTNELQEIYGITRTRISLELVDSTATVSHAGKIRVWRREPALALLDRKFDRIETGLS
jgi:TniQ